MNRRVVVALGVLLIAGCGQPPGPAHPRLWTLFDFYRLGIGGANPALAVDDGLPGGVSVSHFVEGDNGAGFSLAVNDAWTDGQRSAYVSSELWSGFAQVWVQPQYVPVMGWNADGSPQIALGADGAVHPIFGVGPGTLFYSPFWQQIFFDLPPNSSADDFKSSRQVIDAGATLHPAGAVVCPMVPPAAIAPSVDHSPAAAGRTLGKPVMGTGWVDGGPVNYLRLGQGTFDWDASRAVGELPLFNFTFRNDAGDLLRIGGVPVVAGSGGIGSGTPPDVTVPGGQPKYGALWRLYTVNVPATARVFTPGVFADLKTAVMNSGIPLATTIDESVESADPAMLEPWAGKIALNPACFASVAQLDPASGAGSCVWLDSQAAIEREIDPAWIRRTDVLVTCPFVNFQGQPVTL